MGDEHSQRQGAWDRFIDDLDRAGQAGSAADVIVPPLAPDLPSGNRFADLTRGRMAVLISHRFSTTRMADRILVLSGGRIHEQGTHEELVALRGTYAELFELQAAGYR